MLNLWYSARTERSTTAKSGEAGNDDGRNVSTHWTQPTRKAEKPGQNTRILGRALPIDPDTKLGFDWVDRQLTRYTLSMIVRRNLFTLSLERNLPVISNQTESNGGIESNEERTWTIIIFELFLQAFDSLEKVIRKFTKCIIKPFVVRSLSEIDRWRFPIQSSWKFLFSFRSV